MKIAIISDIHENFHNLVSFFEEIKNKEVEQIICLGDLMNAGIAKVLAASPIPVFSIFGNNDGDKVAITKASLAEGSSLEMGFGTYDFLEFDKRKLFITHYPLLAKPMAKSEGYDAVFYGHDHKQNKDKIKNCLVVNPGEISAHKTAVATYAIYDTKTNDAEIIKINDFITSKTEKISEHMKKINVKLSQSKTHQY